jgi:hypothetical protein
MSDYLLFPILELIYPLVDAFGFDSYWLSVVSYFFTASIVSLPVVFWRIFHDRSVHWYEVLAFLVPGFVWGFVIMLSDHQLALCAVSFYIGLFGWLPLMTRWISEAFEIESHETASLLMAGVLCLLPILATTFASQHAWGPPIAIKQYEASPDVIVF